MERQTIIFDNDTAGALRRVLDRLRPQSVHIVTDTNVARDVIPALGLPGYDSIVVPAGEDHKNLSTLSAIWDGLVEGGATRHSLVVNIGGGVITDMGGFAASAFKRGVRFVNIPTTLLSAVDAAVGGKTGVNFNGLKNEIGVFSPATAVVISTCVYATLPAAELLSGYAEMLKHGLLTGGAEFDRLLAFDPVEGGADALLGLLGESVRVKERIVAEDPTEQGIRRALNLGHTAGHAFESLALEKGVPMPHGFAVAAGMVVEMILSHMLHGFPSQTLHRYVAYLKETGYPAASVTCDDYQRLLALMAHDKKNSSPGQINFTLLSAPGIPHIDCICGTEDILSALDIYRELMGIG